MPISIAAANTARQDLLRYSSDLIESCHLALTDKGFVVEVIVRKGVDPQAIPVSINQVPIVTSVST